MSGHGDAHVRLRGGWAALVVLIAMGCGSSAVPPAQSPSVPASPTTGPSVDVPAEGFGPGIDATDDVADAGRKVLEALQAFEYDALDQAIVDGDAATAALEEALAEAAASGTVNGSAVTVPAHWVAIATRARTVSGAVARLQRHDELVFEATGAGRDGRWKAALDTLKQAADELDAVADARDQLEAAADADVGTLTQVIDRYRAYDAALVALYRHERRTGRRDGARFERLLRRVERSQAALPTDNAVLSVIVSELAGSYITSELVGIEQARDRVIEDAER